MTDEFNDAPSMESEAGGDAPADSHTPTPQAGAEPPEPKAPSRRDAILRAMEKTSGDDGETREVPDGPARTPDGKFAPKEAGPDAEKSTDPASKIPAADKPEDAKPEDAKPAQGDLAEAPARFSADAKAAWAAAPRSVQGEIHRAISEMENGIRQKDEQLEPLRPFFDKAKQHGVNLAQVIGNYITTEEHLRQNPIEGLRGVARSLGMTQQDILAVAGVADPQQSVHNQQQRQPQEDPRLSSLTQMVQTQQQQLGQMQFNSVMSQVDQFAAAQPRFDDLVDEMVRMIETGYAANLDDAYQKADRLNPAPAPEPAAQTREQKSVTGAPSAGSNPATRRPSGSRKEAIERAMHRAGLV